jgi:ABC-type sulfate transport system permease subunit
MIEVFIEGLGLFVMLGFALTLLVAAWVVPVAAIFGVIIICTKEPTDD